MSMSDPIADMLTRIRNAQAVDKAVVTMPSSKLKIAIAQVLHDEGYIDGHTIRDEDGKPQLEIALKYHAGRPVIERIERVSRPGLRIYKGRHAIPQVMNGLGVAIVTTPKGVMTDRKARADRRRRRSPLLRGLKGHTDMSRVGKMPIAVPQGVDVAITGEQITVKGANGTLTRKLHPLVNVKNDAGTITFIPANETSAADAMSGTLRALVANMVGGVSKGFERKLTLVGVGFRAQAQGQKLNLQIGYSHPVVKDMPAGIKVATPTQTEILISGADRQVVGQVAAEVRAFRPPEPYKGKGIRYADERVVLKETKKK